MGVLPRVPMTEPKISILYCVPWCSPTLCRLEVACTSPQHQRGLVLGTSTLHTVGVRWLVFQATSDVSMVYCVPWRSPTFCRLQVATTSPQHQRGLVPGMSTLHTVGVRCLVSQASHIRHQYGVRTVYSGVRPCCVG